ncbi:hypothetical protein ACVWY3_004778 [Bradyrhizobium sp. USDA 4486]
MRLEKIARCNASEIVLGTIAGKHQRPLLSSCVTMHDLQMSSPAGSRPWNRRTSRAVEQMLPTNSGSNRALPYRSEKSRRTRTIPLLSSHRPPLGASKPGPLQLDDSQRIIGCKPTKYAIHPKTRYRRALRLEAMCSFMRDWSRKVRACCDGRSALMLVKIQRSAPSRSKPITRAVATMHCLPPSAPRRVAVEAPQTLVNC